MARSPHLRILACIHDLKIVFWAAYCSLLHNLSAISDEIQRLLLYKCIQDALIIIIINIMANFFYFFIFIYFLFILLILIMFDVYFSNYCLVKLKWRSSRGTCAVCHPKILFRKKNSGTQQKFQIIIYSIVTKLQYKFVLSKFYHIEK